MKVCTGTFDLFNFVFMLLLITVKELCFIGCFLCARHYTREFRYIILFGLHMSKWQEPGPHHTSSISNVAQRVAVRTGATLQPCILTWCSC